MIRTDADGVATVPDPNTVELKVTDPGCGLLNVNLRTGRHELARNVRDWREQTRGAYLHQWQQRGIVPCWEAADIVAYVSYPDRRIHDPGNDYPTAKAIVDELVDVGFLPNDSWREVTGPDMRYGGVVRNVFKAAEVLLVCHRRAPYEAR